MNRTHPNPKVRQVSLAIATASPVNILMEIPKSMASMIVCLVSERGGSCMDTVVHTKYKMGGMLKTEMQFSATY